MRSLARSVALPSVLCTLCLLALARPCGASLDGPPEILVESAELVGAESTVGDFVGWSVAIDGDTIAVGDWTAEGAAYVFVRDGGAWVQQARLIPVGATHGFGFGRSIAIEGDTLAVGAPGEDLQGGALYIFERSGGVWDAGVRLDFANASAIGSSVAMDGGRIAVGAAGGAGEVYVLSRNGGSWSVEQVLVAATPTGTDRLGSSVAIQGSTIVAGAPSASDAGPHTGRAYVFVHDGSGWVQSALLLAPDPTPNSSFGEQVAIDGDLLAVGAPAANFAPVGAAYLLTRVGGEWQQEAKVSSPEGSTDDRFGSALALRGVELVVGAHIAGGGTGAAYVYTRGEGLWSLKYALLPTTLDFGSRFGLSTAANGSDVVVGAPYGSPAGSAFVFELGPVLTFNYCRATEHGSGGPCLMGSSGSTSIAGNDLVLRASACPPNGPGLFLCGSTPAQIPMASGYLCISPFHPGIFRLGPVDRADLEGDVSRPLQLDALPAGCSILAGSTWYFQRWFRDTGPGGYNLSDGLGVHFVP